MHALQVDELWVLRRLQSEQPLSSHVFSTERGGPMTAKGFNTLIHRIGERAGMPFSVHPHMLRHACGYALANAGHDTRALQAYLGHKKHPAHRALHQAVAASVQGLLALIVGDRGIDHDPPGVGVQSDGTRRR